MAGHDNSLENEVADNLEATDDENPDIVEVEAQDSVTEEDTAETGPPGE